MLKIFLVLIMSLFISPINSYSVSIYQQSLESTEYRPTDHTERDSRREEARAACPQIKHPLLMCKGDSECNRKVLNDLCTWTWNKKACMEKELAEYIYQRDTRNSCLKDADQMK
jgi:hypothetical protein